MRTQSAPPCIMAGYKAESVCVGGGGYVWGALLNSHNLNYSALDCAIDFLLDRLTESRALGQ